MTIINQSDVFIPKDNQPICVFFETFIASQNPDANPNDPSEPVYPYCHMTGNENEANICLGDYCKCPIAYGKAKIEILKGE